MAGAGLRRLAASPSRGACVTSASVPRWHGRVRADGTGIDLQAKALYRRWLKTKAGRFVTVIIDELRRQRSHSQNAFWWSVVIPMIAAHCGYTTREHVAVHDELLRVLLGERPGSHPAFPIRVSSRALTPAEFNALIESAQLFAAEKLGLVIPDPDPDWAFRRKQAPDGRPSTRVSSSPRRHDGRDAQGASPGVAGRRQ
jgi:hypothetical protein